MPVGLGEQLVVGLVAVDERDGPVGETHRQRLRVGHGAQLERALKHEAALVRALAAGHPEARLREPVAVKVVAVEDEVGRPPALGPHLADVMVQLLRLPVDDVVRRALQFFDVLFLDRHDPPGPRGPVQDDGPPPVGVGLGALDAPHLPVEIVRAQVDELHQAAPVLELRVVDVLLDHRARHPHNPNLVSGVVGRRVRRRADEPDAAAPAGRHDVLHAHVEALDDDAAGGLVVPPAAGAPGLPPAARALPGPLGAQRVHVGHEQEEGLDEPQRHPFAAVVHDGLVHRRGQRRQTGLRGLPRGSSTAVSGGQCAFVCVSACPHVRRTPMGRTSTTCIDCTR